MNPEMVIEQILHWGPIVVTVASAIAIVTPTPVDNAVLGILKKVLDVLALNVGKAESKG